MLEEFKQISIQRNKKISRLFLICGLVLCVPLILSSYKYIGEISLQTFLITGYHFPYFLMACAGVLLCVAAVLQTIKTYTGGYLRKLKEDIKKSGLSPEEIDEDFASALSCYSFRLGQKMIYFLEDQNRIARAYATKRILWAYYGEFPSKKNKVIRKGILLHVEGRMHSVELITPSQDKCKEYLKELADRCPWVIMEYSKELEDLFIHNCNEFKALKYNDEISKVH